MICIENITITFVLLIVIGVVLFLFYKNFNVSSITEKIIIKESDTAGLYPRASYSFSNVSNDVLLNPYEAPLKDDRVFNTRDPRGIPINIPTQSVDTNYRQVGILTRENGGEMILPLMGRPLMTNRDKWNFYTMSDKNNMVKLPIKFNGRNCTSDLGCNDLYTGDVVKVEGYNDDFKVTTYENDMPKYIPFI